MKLSTGLLKERGVFLNEIINTDKAINKIIDTLEKSDGNILLYDTLNNIKICLDYEAIQLLKAYYISRSDLNG